MLYSSSFDQHMHSCELCPSAQKRWKMLKASKILQTLEARDQIRARLLPCLKQDLHAHVFF